MIPSPPASTNLTLGDQGSATFSVVPLVPANNGLGIQWYTNGVPIPAATATNLELTAESLGLGTNSVAVHVTDSTSYVRTDPGLLLHDSIGWTVVVSTTAVPPAIITQPQSQTVIGGNSATFNVAASGATPAYQWRFNGTNIAAATGSSYTRNNAQATHVGSYVVVVTNSYGAVTSAPAVLTVNFILTTAATYGGRVSATPNQSSYLPNSAVTLTATPVSVFPFVGWSGDAGGTNNPLTVLMTTNKTIVANFTSPVPDIIIDNPAATFSGSWTMDAAATNKYGADYRYTGTSPGGSATATFIPDLTQAGIYDVYVWFPTVSKGIATAQFVVSTATAISTNSVNEGTGSSGWLLLASAKTFALGTNGFVRVLNIGQNAKNVVVDAVRWVYSENQIALTPLRIQSFSISNGNIILSWSSIPGHTYRVQYCDSLAGLQWLPLQPDITAVGGSISVSDPLLRNQRLYRVVELGY